MTAHLFTERAQAELDEAAEWIAEENPDAARSLLRAALEAARRLADRPALGRARPDLAPSPYRFWSLRGFLYLLVYNAELNPIRIVRIVHMARDLPAELYDLN